MENDEIREVMEGEKRRGRSRRPIDAEELRRLKALKMGLQRALARKDERELLSALRDAGVKDGSPEFAAALKLFRELAGGSSTGR